MIPDCSCWKKKEKKTITDACNQCGHYRTVVNTWYVCKGVIWQSNTFKYRFNCGKSAKEESSGRNIEGRTDG